MLWTLEVQAKKFKKLNLLQYIENNVIIMKYKRDPHLNISVHRCFLRETHVGSSRIEQGHALQLSFQI